MKNKKKILVVDDELGTRESLRMILQKDYQLLTAISGKEALKIVEEESPHLVLLDIIMPGLDGIEVLKRIKEIDEKINVIMVTATKTVKTAVNAMKLGAYDYLTKPFDLEEVKLLAKKAFLFRDQGGSRKNLKNPEEEKFSGFDDLVGKTAEIKKIFSIIKRVAQSKATVFVSGESGTGKELVARAIHFTGSRKNCPFIAINCAAVPETLIESELFGYEKGSFTNASEKRPGRFEMADSGTLFLDEIGDLSLATQARILRFLQEKELVRVGGSKIIKIDARLVVATNKNLKKSVRDGSFREDLYYRINVIPIPVPPFKKKERGYSFADKLFFA